MCHSVYVGQGCEDEATGHKRFNKTSYRYLQMVTGKLWRFEGRIRRILLTWKERDTYQLQYNLYCVLV
jgi:hypothetical protein